ncbi:CDP-glycerol glycerophosphotransferase family protein [Marinitoga sp. 1155]|uniref:CDP-glycerol glycerophosphotransferase family protein n=1 Tax=Marinitoga sp. 1155 TaxID=1428448 RepID=UPI0006417DE3|nr:CDP-glycerol glycerophosphotransferase family protein [Marinitoga sp. 1155]KLO22765.1 hypothetical protein X274_07690 [Marinitoga sp. 1155]
MIEKLLKFENENVELINYKFNNSDNLMWPFIRMKIFTDIISKKLNLSEPHANKKSIKFSDKIKYFYNLIFNPVFYINKTFDILSISISRTNMLKESKYFNFLYDYYNLIYPEKTIFLEEAFRMKFYKNKYFKNTYLFDSLKLKPYLYSKFNFLKTRDNNIKYFINSLKKIKLFDENYYNNLEKLLNRTSIRVYYLEKLFGKFLRKIKPKILFLNTASYGGTNVILIKVAKEMGIKTAEFQHGVITKSHIAYNYGEEVFKNKEYQKYLPDYLLTYGDFWNENMRIPVKKITIGNPHFWYNYDKINNFKEEINKKRILIVSQGALTNIYVKIAKELSKKISNDYEIIFKLHPGEVAFEERYKDLENYDNIIIKKDGDIYELINISDYIVSIYSTTIFEAASLNKPVYVYKHPMSDAYIPEDIGERVRDTNELYEKIIENIKSKNEYNINYFWNKNWKENYRKFLKDEIGIEVEK